MCPTSSPAPQSQKSLLSLLGLQGGPVTSGIPEYASYLLVELVKKGDLWGVRFLFRNGLQPGVRNLLLFDDH